MHHRIMDELHLDHLHLLKVFKILDQQVELLASGHDPDFFLLTDIAHYIKHYPEFIHHPKENIIYNLLSKKTNNEAEVLAQLQKEHRELPEETNQLDELLNSAASSAIFISRDELKSKIQHFLDIQRKHMDLEEKFIFPLINETLTEEDWNSINTEAMPAHDPLFGDDIEARYENLYQSIKSQGGL